MNALGKYSREYYEKKLKRLMALKTSEREPLEQNKIWCQRAYYKKRAAGVPIPDRHKTRERKLARFNHHDGTEACTCGTCLMARVTGPVPYKAVRRG